MKRMVKKANRLIPITKKLVGQDADAGKPPEPGRVFVVVCTTMYGMAAHPEGGILRVTDSMRRAERIRDEEYAKLEPLAAKAARQFKWLRIVEREVE